MMALIEILILISAILPIFHLFNALFTALRKRDISIFDEKEEKFSILIPCYNEEPLIAFSIKKLRELNYSNYEVIFINDGSSDATLQTLFDELKLHKEYINGMHIYKSLNYENFYVIDNENEGKGSSLNKGIKFSNSPLIITLDADSVLHKDALKHMNKAFIDENVVAAGGAIHIIQGYDLKLSEKTDKLILLQILDYLKGFYIYKLSLHRQNATSIISGAFGAFRRDVLIACGGYRKTLGEDIDITLKIQFMIKNTAKKILYIPQALCYTQCPESCDDLIRQRIRWQKGFINCVIFFKKDIIKTCLYRSLSYHFFIEAFLVGIASIYFSIFTFIVLLLFANAVIIKLYIWYLIVRIAFRSLYSITAVYISKKYHLYPEMTIKKIYKILPFDIFLYPIFLMFLYLGGTFKYFWNKTEIYEWDSPTRSGKNYRIEN